MADQPFGSASAPGVLALRRLASAPSKELAAVLTPGEEREWAGLLERFLATQRRPLDGAAEITAVDRPASTEASPPAGIVWHVDAPALAPPVWSSAPVGPAAPVRSAASGESAASLGHVAPAGSETSGEPAVSLGSAAPAATVALSNPTSSPGADAPAGRTAAVDSLGGAASHASAALASAHESSSSLTLGELREALTALGTLTRAVAGLQAAYARELLVRPPSTSAGPVHKQLGYPSVRVALEHVLGLGTASAHALVDIAESTAPRQGFSAGELPPRYPVLAAALEAGDISAEQARTITQGLPSDHRRLDPAALAAAEAALVGAATAGAHGTMPEAVAEALARAGVTIPEVPDAPGGPGITQRGLVTPVASGRGSLDAHRLRPVALRDQAKLWAAFLDPDGLEPDERKQRQARYLHLTQQANGMWRLSGLAPAFEGAQFKTLLDAMTSPSAQRNAPGVAGTSGKSASQADADAGETTAPGLAAQSGNDGRTEAQRRFDALAAVIVRYATGPDAPIVGGAAPTLLVLTTLGAFAAAAGEEPEPTPESSTSGWHADDTTTPRSGDATGAATRRESPTTAQGTRVVSSSGGCWSPPQPDRPGDGPTTPRTEHPPTGWTAPEHTGLGPDPDNPFDPRNFAGVGWAAEWNRASDSWAGDNAPADEPDPFDPATFAGRGWGASPGDPGASGAPEARQAAAPARPFLPPAREPLPADPLRAVMGVAAWMPHTQQVVSLARVAHLVCGGAVQFMVSDEAGHPLRLGRAQRLFTAHQRKALIARDLHCQAPGCSLPAAFCEAHHLDPWHLGGPTDVGQAVLLCPFHHHLAHQEHGF